MTETRAQIMMGLNKVIINGKDPINPLSSIYIVHVIQAQTLTYTYIQLWTICNILGTP